MAIQYPDFRADPNSVPNAGGWEGIVSSTQKGYMLSQLPAKMRMERDAQAAALQQLQMQNEYYPKVQEQALQKGAMENEWFPKNQQASYDQSVASTDYAKTQNRLAPITAQASANSANASAAYSNEQTRGAATERQRQQAFYNMLAGGGNAQPGGAPAPQQNMGTPGQGGAPQFAPTNGPQTMPAPVTGVPGSQMQSAPPQGQVVNEGNKNLYNIDALYDKNPQYKDMFEKQGLTKTVKNEVNPKTGQLMNITTYPSGKQVATSSQVGPSAGDTAFDTQLGTDRAASYKKYTEGIGSSIQLQNNIARIKDLMQNPDFMNSVGPVNSTLNRALGGDASKLTGEIGVLTGNMQAEVANTLGSQAPKARLQMAKLMKADVKDTSDVFAGKMLATDVLSQWNKDYSSYMAQAVRSGKTEDEAMQAAPKAMNWQKYETEMENRVNTGKLASQLRDSGKSIQYKDSVPWVEVPKIKNSPTDEGTGHVPVSNYNDYMAAYNKQINGGG